MESLINDTEKQIFEAALKVFQKKGLAGARMQEIADEAGINKSMLHYYFRSKEKLFHQIFTLSLKQFLGSVIPVLNNTHTDWREKLKALAAHYTSFMIENPDLPFFVLNEMRYNTDEFLNSVDVEKVIVNSVFIKQIKDAMQQGEIKNINPAQILVTLISSIIFPFLGKPLVNHIVNAIGGDWDIFVREREYLIADMLINYLESK